MSRDSETAVGHELQDSRCGAEEESTQTSITEGESDAELNTFIKMRNKADKDTEVRNKCTCTMRCANTNKELSKRIYFTAVIQVNSESHLNMGI